MIVPMRALPPLALLVALVTVTVCYNAGIAQAPLDFFGAQEDVVLMLPSTGRVSSAASVSTGVVDILRERPDVAAASPEVIVMGATGGASLFARGVEAAAFLAIEEGAVVEGTMPSGVDEALAGRGLARRLGLAVGDTLVVAGSVQHVAASVRVVGIFEAEGASRDELLLSLPLARGLVGIPPDVAHLIRIQTTDPANVTRLIASVAPVFTYSDVRISSESALLGDEIVVRANLTNWGVVDGVKDVVLRANDRIVAQEQVGVGARSSVPIEISFTPTAAGPLNVTLNPTFNVTVREKSVFLRDAPAAFVAGEPTRIRLRDAGGAPAAGVEIRAGNLSVTSDEDGSANLTLPTVGFHALQMTRDGEPVGAERVYATLAEHRDRPVTRVRAAQPPLRLLGSAQGGILNVTLENVGGVPGDVRAAVSVDGAAVGEVFARLDPGEFQRVAFALPELPEGKHEVIVEGWGPRMRVEAVEGDPRVEEALRAREAARANPALVAKVGDEAAGYVDRIVASVSLAAIVISISAGTLAALGALATWSRHLAERARSVGVLKSLGARREQVEWIAVREAALLSVGATAAGLAAGILVALALDATGMVRAFGHVVHPSFALAPLATLGLLSIVANMLLARALVAALYRRPADELLRGQLLTPAAVEAPTLDAVLRGDA